MFYDVGDLVCVNRALEVGGHKVEMAYTGIILELIKEKQIHRGMYRIRVLKGDNDFTRFYFNCELSNLGLSAELKDMFANKEEIELVN